MVGFRRCLLFLSLLTTYRAFFHRSSLNNLISKLRQTNSPGDVSENGIEEYATLDYNVSPKHWVLQVGDLKKNLDWFERNFNFTVVYICINTHLYCTCSFILAPWFPSASAVSLCAVTGTYEWKKVACALNATMRALHLYFAFIHIKSHYFIQKSNLIHQIYSFAMKSFPAALMQHAMDLVVERGPRQFLDYEMERKQTLKCLN